MRGSRFDEENDRDEEEEETRRAPRTRTSDDTASSRSLNFEASGRGTLGPATPGPAPDHVNSDPALDPAGNPRKSKSGDSGRGSRKEVDLGASVLKIREQAGALNGLRVKLLQACQSTDNELFDDADQVTQHIL